MRNQLLGHPGSSNRQVPRHNGFLFVEAVSRKWQGLLVLESVTCRVPRGNTMLGMPPAERELAVKNPPYVAALCRKAIDDLCLDVPPIDHVNLEARRYVCGTYVECGK